VLERLSHVQQAIILACKQEEKLECTFRPNLMFEWGYLIRRLEPAYLHVFLVGITGKSLPSDVSGFAALEINNYDLKDEKDKIAEEIIKNFCNNHKEFKS
jgi:predicted nucleotide-binding protein